MKKIYIAIFALVFIILLFFLFKKETHIKNLDSKGTTIVAFGDSLIEGVGSTQNNDLVSVLSKKINTPIINLGVSGNTSEMGLSRIDEVIAQNPKLVFVSFGGNDFLRKVPVETTFQNIEKIISKLQEADSAVVLLGIRGGVLSDPYAKRFEDLAQRYGAFYVPNVLQNIIGNQSLMSDAVHPNDAGYKIIADKILKVLDFDM